MNLSVDDIQVSFDNLACTAGDIDEILKVYLFRGWFLTEVLNGESPDINRCPCCNQLLKKNEVDNKETVKN